MQYQADHQKLDQHPENSPSDHIGALENDQFKTFLESFFYNSPIGLYIVHEGRFELVNSEFLKSTGYTEKELIGKKSLSVVHPDCRESVRKKAIDMLKGRSSTPYEFRIIRKSGEEKWIMETVTPLVFRKKTAVLGNFMDITKQKNSAEALRQSEVLYRSVVEQATEIIYLIDAKTKNIIKTNSALQKVLGLDAKDLIGLSIYDFIAHDKKDIDSHIQHILEKGERFIGERKYRHKNGHLIDMEVSANLITYGDREVLCVVARDITERKRVEQENKFLTQSLISVAEDERKKLARDLHDELGQTLTALRFWFDTYQDLIPSELSNLKKKAAQSSQFIDQISNSIRNILVELRPAMLDDLGIIPTLQWYTEFYINQQNDLQINLQTLGFKKRPHPDIEIVLFRVFQECLNNIIKHANAKHVDISLTYSYPKIIFMVKDDGIGFDQTSHSHLTPGQKHGIGLLGMRERVASIGGTIEVQSRPGKGTLVRAELNDFIGEPNG